jgi:hypothetical protein
MQFTVDAAFSKGYDLFKSRYGALLSATGVFILILVAVGIVKLIINRELGIPPEQTDPSTTDHLINIFISNPLGVGLVFITLLHLRNESPPMSTLFAGFKRYWPIVGINVLISLIVFIPIAAAALTLGFTAIMGAATSSAPAVTAPIIVIAAVGAGVIVFVAIIMIVTRLFFASLLCIDPRHRLGVGASLATSWRMTGPVFWPLLGLIIIMALILIGTTILLVLPLIFVGIPLCLAITASAYELIINGQDIDAQGDATLSSVE